MYDCQVYEFIIRSKPTFAGNNLKAYLIHLFTLLTRVRIWRSDADHNQVKGSNWKSFQSAAAAGGQEWATPEFSLQTNISLHSLIDLNIITLEHDWAEWTIKMRVLMMVSCHWSVSVMCLHSWPIITGFTRKHFTLSTTSDDDDPRYNLIISLTSLNMSSWHWAYWSSQTPSPYLRCWHSRLMIMRIMMIEISLQPAMMITIYILDILLHACCRHVLKLAIKCKKILLLSIIDNHQTRVFNNNCHWRLSFNSCSRQ